MQTHPVTCLTSGHYFSASVIKLNITFMCMLGHMEQAPLKFRRSSVSFENIGLCTNPDLYTTFLSLIATAAALFHTNLHIEGNNLSLFALNNKLDNADLDV